MSALATAESELAMIQGELQTIYDALGQDPADPSDLLLLKDELEAMLPAIEENIAKLKPKATPAAPKDPSPPAEQPKWSRENHPAFKKPQTASVDTAPVPHQYQSGEKVMALWKRQWSPAIIRQIMGSAANPKFYVKYEGFNDYETLESYQVKPIENRKRKVDDTFTPPVSKPGSSVITAAANINASLADQVKREPSKVSDGPTRPAKIPKKVATKKALDKNQNTWKDFNAKAPAKMKKKESMFRTGEGVTARVGFTGSGQAMRKDAPRSRHVYTPAEIDDN